MKLRHTFLIAAVIAIPLWIRQYRFEQKTGEEALRFTAAVDEVIGGLAEQINRNAEATNQAFDALHEALEGGER
jgi:hypothetical protein